MPICSHLLLVCQFLKGRLKLVFLWLALVPELTVISGVCILHDLYTAGHFPEPSTPTVGQWLEHRSGDRGVLSSNPHRVASVLPHFASVFRRRD